MPLNIYRTFQCKATTTDKVLRPRPAKGLSSKASVATIKYDRYSLKSAKLACRLL